MRSTLAKIFPMVLHSRMILRVGLNMFWISTVNMTSRPTVIVLRSISHRPVHTTAVMESASSRATTQLKRADRLAVSSAASMAFLLCTPKRSVS